MKATPASGTVTRQRSALGVLKQRSEAMDVRHRFTIPPWATSAGTSSSDTSSVGLHPCQQPWRYRWR